MDRFDEWAKELLPCHHERPCDTPHMTIIAVCESCKRRPAVAAALRSASHRDSPEESACTCGYDADPRPGAFHTRGCPKAFASHADDAQPLRQHEVDYDPEVGSHRQETEGETEAAEILSLFVVPIEMKPHMNNPLLDERPNPCLCRHHRARRWLASRGKGAREAGCGVLDHPRLRWVDHQGTVLVARERPGGLPAGLRGDRGQAHL